MRFSVLLAIVVVGCGAAAKEAPPASPAPAAPVAATTPATAASPPPRPPCPPPPAPVPDPPPQALPPPPKPKKPIEKMTKEERAEWLAADAEYKLLQVARAAGKSGVGYLAAGEHDPVDVARKPGRPRAEVRIDDVTGTSPIPDAAYCAVAAFAPRYRDCYQADLNDDPKTGQGKMTIRGKLHATGSIPYAFPDNAFDGDKARPISSRLASCLIRPLMGARIAPEGNSDADFTVHLTFTAVE